MRFPNVEAIVIAHLNEGLESVKAYADVPANRPAVFVTVERTGGAQLDVVREQANIAIQCWAETRHEASELALIVDAIMESVTERNHVYRYTRNSIANFPDFDSSTPRYQIYAHLIISTNS